MKLGKISYVILGAIGAGPRSGYDVKALVDRSTRFFWAASYGQIYPELRRLAEAGLIEGEDASQGGRARTLYRLTAAGEAALRDYLRAADATCEVRHEGLLKLFFSDALDEPDAALERVRALRHQHAEILSQLRDIAATAPDGVPPARRLVLEYGLGLHGWAVAWCEDVERRLADRAPDVERGT